ncbi:hypothetical protein [Brevundimonas aveniformis]|uniref:hypothetical protein n=1 Tax=Brevundimonas aveniformis TaxID=370977 RepID=UPI00048C0D84|nr:hypothetical protein [Brevundimonas aveniformis]
MKFLFASISGAVTLLIAGPTVAQQQRICEGAVRGPAGEHIFQILLENAEPVYAMAMWRPPNQTALAGSPLPMVVLYYRVHDIQTGAHGPLFYAHVIHAARISESRATSAEVRIRQYGQTEWLERQDWTSFAEARRNDGYSIAGSVSFNSPAALELFSTAPQVESRAITNDNVRISSGIWNLTGRIALDALLERAHAEAVRRMSNPIECIRPNDATHQVIIGAWRLAREHQEASPPSTPQ